ncbi:hypothetical protein B0H14DRAFT_3532975 [Mycena olivaceomarginata]|nr:hypothetical protein B0H14DRAFT_3532975 [Mycena olivaceomarginata]
MPRAPSLALCGSPYNPIVVDENGMVVSRLVSRLEPRTPLPGSLCRTPSGRLLRIYGTSPSESGRLFSGSHPESPSPLVPDALAAMAVTRTTTSISFLVIDLLIDLVVPAPCDFPLTEDELYTGPERPPAESNSEPGFASIFNPIPCRTCVDIRTAMHVYVSGSRTSGPAPPVTREEAIARDHPDWVDLSTVTYSFKGLRFPIPDPRDNLY